MNDPVRIVEIDRLRLTGLEITPGRGERIQAMVEAELQRLLERGGWHDSLASGEVSRLAAPKWHADMPSNDGHLASGLARSIAQTLRGVE